MLHAIVTACTLWVFSGVKVEKLLGILRERKHLDSCFKDDKKPANKQRQTDRQRQTERERDRDRDRERERERERERWS